MPTNYKVMWSYTGKDGKVHREYDLFFEWSARDAVSRVYSDYAQYSDLRIIDVYKECSNCWTYVEPFLWEYSN